MKRYGLIGYPLGHSFSARYFADKFAREGIADCRYDLYELKTIEELPALLEAQPELRGFNVTIPYKQQIIPYLDDLSPETRMIGAVNCVRCEGRRLTGYNTDVTGLRASLETFLGGERPERALVLGTGGASQAVQYVLAQMEIPFDLVSRNPATGNYTYDEVSDEVIGSHRLIINASPVGMHPNVEEAPRIPYAFVTPSHYLFDQMRSRRLITSHRQSSVRNSRSRAGSFSQSLKSTVSTVAVCLRRSGSMYLSVVSGA